MHPHGAPWLRPGGTRERNYSTHKTMIEEIPEGIRHAADEIDAAIFSGDCFTDPQARATMREVMARWERGLKEFDAIHVHEDTEIGMTMGETNVEQLPDGSWKATCPIGTLFGTEVEGECSGTGPTKEAALESLKADRKN